MKLALREEREEEEATTLRQQQQRMQAEEEEKGKQLQWQQIKQRCSREMEGRKEGSAAGFFTREELRG